MTHTEIKRASTASLWTRLEALEFADDAQNLDEIFKIQDEISSRETPWARLQASWQSALNDEALERGSR
jgi:hypothetical protein